MQVTPRHTFIPPSLTTSVPRFCPFHNMRKAQQVKLGAFSGGCKQGAKYIVSWRFLIAYPSYLRVKAGHTLDKSPVYP